mmetsp:Transcript_50076/g.109043  ORF Transcript_50076/g.109043 Transcript_50076/m.109043 type:complete len:243 (+) Transcript_50076:415-1143(+)
MVQGSKLVDFLHNQFQRVASTECFLLVHYFHDSRGSRASTLYLSDHAKRSHANNALNSVIIFWLSLASVDEHVAREVHRFHLFKLHHEQDPIKLLELLLAQELVLIRVETLQVVLYMALRELSNAKLGVHLLHALQQLLKAEFTVSIYICVAEARPGIFLEFVLIVQDLPDQIGITVKLLQCLVCLAFKAGSQRHCFGGLELLVSRNVLMLLHSHRLSRCRTSWASSCGCWNGRNRPCQCFW